MSERTRKPWAKPSGIQIISSGSVGARRLRCTPDVLAELRGLGAEVDGDIPDVAGEDAEELALGLAELVMEAAKDSLARERLVVLDEVVSDPGACEGDTAEDLGEPSTVVAEDARTEKFLHRSGRYR